MDLPKQAKMTRESTMSICANLNQLECDDSKEPTTPPKPNSRQKGFDRSKSPHGSTIHSQLPRYSRSDQPQVQGFGSTQWFIFD